MKKLLLSLGTLSAVAAPVAAVVACGSSTEYSDFDQTTLGKVSTSEATRAVEADWLIEVLSNAYGDDTISVDTIDPTSTSAFTTDFLKTARYVLKKGLENDPAYLTKIYSSVIATGNTVATGASDGFNNQVFDKSKVGDAVDATKISNEDLLNVIYNKTKDTTGDEYNPISLSFKTLVLKDLITQKYLQLNRAEWASVFKTEDSMLSDYISATTSDKTAGFPLIKDAMERKLAVKWEVKLDETDSTQFIDFTKPNNLLPSVFPLMSTDAKVIDHITWTQKNAKLTDSLFNADDPMLGSTKLENLVGYAGLTSLPSGEKGLLFTKDGIIAQGKDKTARTGILEEGKIISDATKPVKYIQKGGKTFDVTFLKSLMPVYDESSKDLLFNSDVNIDELRLAIATSDTGLYQDAMKYYTTDIEADADKGIVKRDAIKLKINNEAIAKIWIDKGLSFVEFDAGAYPSTTAKTTK